jgi:hypothetical protein
MTPSKAIKMECGVCRRGQGPCTSKHCALEQSGTSLQRIKAHCQNCAPDHRTEECTGQIVGTQAKALNALYHVPLIDGKAQCPLYPFRYGKNPNLSRVLSADQKKVNAARLQSYRFQKKETFLGPERIKA